MLLTFPAVLLLTLFSLESVQAARPGSPDPPSTYSYRAWSTPEGAPHSYINEVTMTPDGNVWVETSYGFARFNGVGFTEVPLPEIRNSIYRNLTVDHAGRMWMHAPGSGVFVRLPSGEIKPASFIPNDRHLHFLAHGEQVYAWNCCSVFRIDYDASRIDTLLHHPDARRLRTFDRIVPLSGGKWVMRALNDLIVLSPSGQRVVPLSPRSPNFQTRDLTLLNDGIVVVSTSQSLLRFEGESLVPFPLRGVQPGTDFARLHTGVDGHLYVASSTGLYRFRNQDLTVEAEHLSPHDGVSVFVMTNGQIWYGTKFSGLLLLTPRVFEHFVQPPFVSSIEGMAQDREGRLWVTSNCTGVYQFTGRRLSARYMSTFSTGNPCRWGLFVDSRGTLWSGSWGNGLARFDGRTFRKPTERSDGVTLTFVEFPDGRLFAGTSHESIIQIDPATGAELRLIAPSNPDSLGVVRGLLVDRSGTLWVGTTHRIWRLLPNGEIEDVLISGRREGARTFYEAPDGSLWAGLLHYGVARVNPPSERTYGRAEGLGNNTVSFLFPFRSSLLIGTNAGIVQVPYAGLKAFMDGLADRPNRRILGAAEGMPVAETNGGFSSPALMQPDSSLLIATPAGVLVMYPKFLPSPPKNAQVVIERAQADSLTLTTQDVNILPLGARRIQIDYLALTFSPSGEDYYETWLEGLDAGWVPAGSRTDITYQNLSPGRYTFRVRAFTKQGDLLETRAPLVFIVPPYFHETPPFWILVLVLALVGLFSFDRLQRHRLSQRQRELEQLVGLRTDELATRNLELAHAVEAKDRMLGVASHDIRSPLASIVSMTELLEASDLDPESRAYVHDIRDVADRTLRLVQDVLSMARMKEIGHAGLTRAPLQLDTLVTEVVKEHTFDAQQKRQQIQCSIGAHVIQADAGLLRQALTNLLSNAIKYSPADSAISISLDVHADIVRLTVADQGPGVDADKVDLIFEPFTKGNAVPTAGEQSTGLGLAIVREIVTAHGGRVWCEPVIPRGACFVVELPYSDAPEASGTSQ